MSSIFLCSPLFPLTLPLHHHASCHHLHPRYTSTCCYRHPSISQCLSSSISRKSLSNRQPSISAVTPSNEGAISVINFEDFVEKDWSFLETDNTNTGEANKTKTDRIISAGEIEETSKVLVSVGSEGFVDQMVDSSPCQQLLVVHDSLLTLACIKEKYDKVNCWQGELIYLPEKWSSFDVVFLYFLPALPFELGQVFGSLAKRCLPGNVEFNTHYWLLCKVLSFSSFTWLYVSLVFSKFKSSIRLLNGYKFISSLNEKGQYNN